MIKIAIDLIVYLLVIYWGGKKSFTYEAVDICLSVSNSLLASEFPFILGGLALCQRDFCGVWGVGSGRREHQELLVSHTLELALV